MVRCFARPASREEMEGVGEHSAQPCTVEAACKEGPHKSTSEQPHTVQEGGACRVHIPFLGCTLGRRLVHTHQEGTSSAAQAWMPSSCARPPVGILSLVVPNIHHIMIMLLKKPTQTEKITFLLSSSARC